MLILRSTNTLKRGSIWRPGAAFAIVCDDAEIGRIEINGAPEKDGAARISLRERSLECCIHITGKKRWTYVPSRWVMYSGDTALHGATCENRTSFLTRTKAGAERASDQRRVGKIRDEAPAVAKARGASHCVRYRALTWPRRSKFCSVDLRPGTPRDPGLNRAREDFVSLLER